MALSFDPRTKLFDVNAFPVMPVLHMVEQKSYVMGSAACLWPGMFLTATHNVDDWGGSPGFQRDRSIKPISPEQYKVDVLHLPKQGPPLRWHVSGFKKIGISDVTLLQAESHTGELGKELLQAGIKTTLDFHVPNRGEIITTAGFITKYKEPVEAYDIRHIELHNYKGTVDDFDFFGMPKANSPAIQTNAPVIRGMSGGPVFNSKGRLIGICSTGIEPEDAEEGVDYYTSWISLIMPILFEPIMATLPEGKTMTTIYAMAKKGYIEAHGVDHFIPREYGFDYQPIVPECEECGLLDILEDMKVLLIPMKSDRPAPFQPLA